MFPVKIEDIKQEIEDIGSLENIETYDETIHVKQEHIKTEVVNNDPFTDDVHSVFIKQEIEDETLPQNKNSLKQNGIVVKQETPNKDERRNIKNKKSQKKTYFAKYACNHCEFRGTDKLNLDKHKRIRHSDERPFNCDLCEFSCKRKYELKAHDLKHRNIRPFKCDRCGYSCSTKNELKLHNVKHSDKKPFKCNQCAFCTKYKNMLAKHKLRHSVGYNKEGYFKCDQCKYRCMHEKQIVRHKAAHIPYFLCKDRPFKCNQCEYSCIDNYKLDRHKLIHTNGRFLSL